MIRPNFIFSLKGLWFCDKQYAIRAAHDKVTGLKGKVPPVGGDIYYSGQALNSGSQAIFVETVY